MEFDESVHDSSEGNKVGEYCTQVLSLTWWKVFIRAAAWGKNCCWVSFQYLGRHCWVWWWAEVAVGPSWIPLPCRYEDSSAINVITVASFAYFRSFTKVLPVIDVEGEQQWEEDPTLGGTSAYCLGARCDASQSHLPPPVCQEAGDPMTDCVCVWGGGTSH